MSEHQASSICYQGTDSDIASIAEGLPGSSSSPAGWLVKLNWMRAFPILAKPGFRWVANKEGLGMKRIIEEAVSSLPNNPVSFLQMDYTQNNQDFEEEEDEPEYEEDEEEEVEETYENDIEDWLEY